MANDNMKMIVEIGAKIDASVNKGIEALKRDLQSLGDLSSVASAVNKVAASFSTLNATIGSFGPKLKAAMSSVAAETTVFGTQVEKLKKKYDDLGNTGKMAFDLLVAKARENTNSLSALFRMFSQARGFGEDSPFFKAFTQLARGSKSVAEITEKYKLLQKVYKEVATAAQGAGLGSTLGKDLLNVDNILQRVNKRMEELASAKSLKGLEGQLSTAIAPKADTQGLQKILDDFRKQDLAKAKAAAKEEADSTYAARAASAEQLRMRRLSIQKALTKDLSELEKQLTALTNSEVQIRNQYEVAGAKAKTNAARQQLQEEKEIYAEKFRLAKEQLQLAIETKKKEVAASSGNVDKERVANTRAVNAALKEQTGTVQANIAAIKAKEQAEIAASKATAKMAAEQQRLAAALTPLDRLLQQVGRAFRTITSYLVSGAAVYAFTGAIKGAAAAIVNFDQSLKDLQGIAQATNGQILFLSERMLSIGTDSKYALSELGGGLTTLAQAGYTAEESISLLGPIVNFATGTLSDMKTSVDLVSTVINSFELNVAGARHAVDVLANAVNKSKLTTEGLRTAFNYIGPVAHDAGVTLEQTAASLGIMANAGLRASTMGTAFRNILDRLIAPTTDVEKKFKALGVEMFELNPAGRNFEDVLDRLRSSIKSTGDAFDVFGVRAAPAVLALLNVGKDGFTRMREEMNATGTAAAMAGTVVEGLGNKFQMVQNKLEVLAAKLGQGGIGAIFRAVADGANKVLEVLINLSNPMTSLIVTVGGLSLALNVLRASMVALSGTRIATFFAELIPSLATATRHFALLKAAGTGGMVAGFQAMSVGAQGLGASLLALAANPITLVVAGIGSLLFLYDRWETSATRLIASQKEVIKGIDDELEKTQARIANTKSLVAILENSTSTEQTKIETLKQMQSSMNDVGFASTVYSDGMKITSASVKEATTAAAAFTLELRRQEAVLQGRKINQLVTDINALTSEYQKMEEQIRDAADAIEALGNYDAGAALAPKMKEVAKEAQQLKDQLNQLVASFGNLDGDVAIGKMLDEFVNADKTVMEQLQGTHKKVSTELYMYRLQLMLDEQKITKETYSYLEKAWSSFEQNRKALSSEAFDNIVKGNENAIDQQEKSIKRLSKAHKASAAVSTDAWVASGKAVISAQDKMYDMQKAAIDEYETKVRNTVASSPKAWAASRDKILTTMSGMYDKLKTYANNTLVEIETALSKISEEIKKTAQKIADLEKTKNKAKGTAEDESYELSKAGKSDYAKEEMDRKRLAQKRKEAEELAKTYEELARKAAEMNRAGIMNEQQAQQYKAYEQQMQVLKEKIEEVLEAKKKLTQGLPVEKNRSDGEGKYVDDANKRERGKTINEDYAIRKQLAELEQKVEQEKLARLQKEEALLQKKQADASKKQDTAEGGFNKEAFAASMQELSNQAAQQMNEKLKNAVNTGVLEGIPKTVDVTMNIDTTAAMSALAIVNNTLDAIKAKAASIGVGAGAAGYSVGGLAGAIRGMWGGIASFGGFVRKLATGGPLPGFGGGDILPAWLEPGEFVVNKYATRAFLPLLHDVNSFKGRTSAQTKQGISAYAGGGAAGVGSQSLMTVRLQNERGLEQDMNLYGQKNIDVFGELMGSLSKKRLTTVSSRG